VSDEYWFRQRYDDANFAQAEGMMFPARCRWCSGVYDLAKVTVTGRYTDCSMWKAPCCGVTADDRKPPWGISHYTELPRQDASPEAAGTETTDA